MLPRSVRLRPIHALASAAVPLLFPPVQIEGRFFCDGGLRQNVPLSPARRLGSDALIVINPRFVDPKAENPLAGRRHEEIKPTPLTIVGKTLNALMLDRIDHDLERLRKVNAFIDAGSSVFGSSFSKEIRQEMNTSRSTGLRKIDVVHIRPSQNIGQMCTAFVQSKEFRVGGIVGKVMKRLAESDATREADLLSYLLLDGSFASQLIELGKQDGRRYHDALCELFERHRTRAGQ